MLWVIIFYSPHYYIPERNQCFEISNCQVCYLCQFIDLVRARNKNKLLNFINSQNQISKCFDSINSFSAYLVMFVLSQCQCGDDDAVKNLYFRFKTHCSLHWFQKLHTFCNLLNLGSHSLVKFHCLFKFYFSEFFAAIKFIYFKLKLIIQNHFYTLNITFCSSPQYYLVWNYSPCSQFFLCSFKIFD